MLASRRERGLLVGSLLGVAGEALAGRLAALDGVDGRAEGQGIRLADDLPHHHTFLVDEEGLRDPEHAVGDGRPASRVREVVGSRRPAGFIEVAQ